MDQKRGTFPIILPRAHATRVCDKVPFGSIKGGHGGESTRQEKPKRAIPLTGRELERGRAQGERLGAPPRLGLLPGAPRTSEEESPALETPRSSGQLSIIRKCSGSPAYVSVGRRRVRSSAAWRQRETSRRHSRWRNSRPLVLY